MSKITYIVKWRSGYSRYVRIERFFSTFDDAEYKYNQVLNDGLFPEMWIEYFNEICEKLK